MDLTKICKYLNNNYMNEYEYIEYGNLWDVKVSVAFLDNFKIEGDTLVAPVQITVEDDDGKSIDEVEYYKTDFIFYIENNVIKLKLNQYPREVSEYYDDDPITFFLNAKAEDDIWDLYNKSIDTQLKLM